MGSLHFRQRQGKSREEQREHEHQSFYHAAKKVWLLIYCLKKAFVTPGDGENPLNTLRFLTLQCDRINFNYYWYSWTKTVIKMIGGYESVFKHQKERKLSNIWKRYSSSKIWISKWRLWKYAKIKTKKINGQSNINYQILNSTIEKGFQTLKIFTDEMGNKIKRKEVNEKLRNTEVITGNILVSL